MVETRSSTGSFQIICWSAALIGLAVFLMAGLLLWLWWLSPHYTTRDVLLRMTDHEALRAACLELIARRDSFGQETPPGLNRELDPRDPRIPEAIRNLHPTSVAVSDRRVHIELHGGFEHYGVCFCVDRDDVSEGKRELAEGLWCYSEGDPDHQPLPERDKAKRVAPPG
jgi:hypothetical protein